MVANVFVVIIPNQKRTVADLMAGRIPNPAMGDAGKQRSVHNNYLTLPVVFLMISNHYPLLYATRYNWLIVAIVLLIGPLIRHFYNSRHAGAGNPWWVWAAVAAGMVAVVLLSAAGPRPAAVGAAPARSNFAAVQDIVLSRCSMCHAGEPVWDGIVTAPKDVRLDSERAILDHARRIEAYAVRSNAMPPGNVTEMTGEERALLGAWLAGGAGAE
jgi:uncharacterized membrane protein